VVGTRKASTYGLQCAQQIAEQLSPDAIVVSGGAAGVDTRAMQAAVDAGGIAVAVLGCGVDITYPKTNRKLFMDVMEKGCILSEYPPQTQPLQWHFPARNRIISGLSDGVLVVEAPEKSGALITARDALEQGRDVFAIPGNIDNLSCAGSNSLLNEGATAVFSGEDIFKNYLEAYPQLATRKPKKAKPAPASGQSVPTEAPAAPADKKVIDNSQANPYSDGENKQTVPDGPEAAVLACLTHSPKPMDEVMAMVDLPANTVLSILMKLSVKGQVIQHPGKLVSLK
jgi:DNA processing protein